jgi:hypothetical protein
VIVVGASRRQVGNEGDQGELYAFDRPGAAWSSEQQSASFVERGGSANDSFGGSAAIQGHTIVSGAPTRMDNAGSASLLTLPGPALSRLMQSRRTWTLGRRPALANPHHPPARGTVFRFRLSQPAATLALRFTARVHGHRRHVGTLTMAAKAGSDAVSFDGVIGHGRRLDAGRFTVTITARHGNGRTPAKTLHFKTRRGH